MKDNIKNYLNDKEAYFLIFPSEKETCEFMQKLIYKKTAFLGAIIKADKLRLNDKLKGRKE